MDSDYARCSPDYARVHPIPHWGEAAREMPLHRIETLEAETAPQTHDLSGWSLSRTRRLFDFALALVALIVLLPLMIMLAVVVRLSSTGPALFKQKRMGRNGQVFTLYKFRSMRIESGDTSPITVTGDSRITRFGGILRRYKLDELPQFWNVLNGDMSMVGPRPKLPHHEALHMPFRPGITGAASLAFRSEEEMLSQVPREHLDVYYDRFVKPTKARIDWEYMCFATLATDIGILWQTARACLSERESSYRVELPEFEETAHEFALRETRTKTQTVFSASAV